MKKILSFLTILALLSTSTTNLVSCSSTNTAVVEPIAPPIAPIREFGVDYTFTNTGSWAAHTSYTVEFNSGTPDSLYLIDGDKIQMTWDWTDGSKNKYDIDSITLGTAIKVGIGSNTLNITFNNNNLNFSGIWKINGTSKFKIKLIDPSAPIPIIDPNYLVETPYGWNPDAEFFIYCSASKPAGLSFESGDSFSMTWYFDDTSYISYTINSVTLGTAITPSEVVDIKSDFKITFTGSTITVTNFFLIGTSHRFTVTFN